MFWFKKKSNIIHFYDLTFLRLYNCDTCKQIVINRHLEKNRNKYNNGDILFVGSSSQSNPLYGFAYVIKDKKNIKFIETGDIDESMKIPNSDYSQVVSEIKNFLFVFSFNICLNKYLVR